MNHCTWKPSRVRLFDMREVDSNSPEWMSECEARHYLAKPFTDIGMVLSELSNKRGAEAVEALKLLMDKVRPAFVLDLPNKPQRRAYLAKYEFQAGANAAEHLRTMVLALNDRRKEAEASCADKAA